MADSIVEAENATEAAQTGGKAAALAQLMRAGFDVPPFFVLTPAAFANGALVGDLASLDAALDRLGAEAFAVRSSGVDEDGAAHSHAGQYLSILDVSRALVASAAARVWASGKTASLEAYRTARGLGAGGGPAVIVQRLVKARAAGVMFGADPVSGRRDRLLIAATAGLGDRLVSGETDGDDYLLDRNTGLAITGPPEGGVLPDADLASLWRLASRVEAACGAPQDIEWAFEGERLFLLQARPITTPLRPLPAADTAITIFDNSNIIESYPGLVSPLTFSFAQYVYARVYRTFLALAGVGQASIRRNASLFENMLGRLDGRVYYNLINWYRALALLPGFAINRTHMETMMGVGEPLPAHIADALAPEAKGAALIAEYGRVAHVAARLAVAALRLRFTVRGFYARLHAALESGVTPIDAMPLSALAAEYRRIEAELLERWDAPLVNDFLCMVAFGASRKLMERWAGAEGLALHNDIMIGQGDIISAEPPQRIARMGRLAADAAAADPSSSSEAIGQVKSLPSSSEGIGQQKPGVMLALTRGERPSSARWPELAREIDAYIAKFGDRCAEELKLESITLDKDPAPLLAAIAASASTANPAKPVRNQNPKLLGGLFKGRPFRATAMRALMAWAKARVRDRENLRFERTRVFGRARRVFLAMGAQFHATGVLDEPRDIFFLTVQEVLGAIEGFGVTADLKGLATLRKAEHARHAQLPDPPERVTVGGAAILRDCQHQVTAAAPSDDAVRSGTGCSAGTTRGVARVVADPRQARLERGEILVARHTDPGWIALFANASAIVVERGSLLSHSAIIARELGIPCVVGLKGAMSWLQTGDIVEVDGTCGRVRKCDAL